MNTQTSRLQRFSAVTLFYGLLAASVWGIVLPVIEHLQEMDARLRADRATAARLTAGQVSVAFYDEALAGFEKALQADTRYLPGTSQALAAAALQGIVEETLAGAGATVRSAQDVTQQAVQDEDAALAPIPVVIRVTAQATYPDLLRALHALEDHTPYILIDDLNIRSTSRGAPAEEWLPMSLQFEATAFMPPASSPSG